MVKIWLGLFHMKTLDLDLLIQSLDLDLESGLNLNRSHTCLSTMQIQSI